ncbi:hypothetical protein GW17_00056708 [Ensete ventricosum]|nr:hypothetical protein GW17_00056708 [Ensete ventricosum]
MTDLSPLSSTLTGFIGVSIAPLEMIVLLVTLSQEPRSKTLVVTFMVVGLPTAYNIILGQSILNRLKAVISTYHHAMKFLTVCGVGEARGNPWESMHCYLTVITLPKKARGGHSTRTETVTPAPSLDQPLVDP